MNFWSLVPVDWPGSEILIDMAGERVPLKIHYSWSEIIAFVAEKFILF